MSWAYMALYTGDYLRDTRHLTSQKHGIYLLLLMYCWDIQGPAPLDEQECAGICNCRSADEIDSLRYVLERFFVKMDDGWYNQRMQREISKALELSKVWSVAGKKGAQAKPRPNVGQASATTHTLTPLHTHTTTQTPSASPQLPPWLPPEVWSSYLEHRRAKRAKVTPQAADFVIKKLEKLKAEGQNPVAVIEQTIANGWTGLFPVQAPQKRGAGPAWWASEKGTLDKGAELAYG